MQTLLIAGTNAQVGKTVVLSALIAYWQRYRAQQIGVMKPIDWSGSSAQAEPDCERLRRLFNLPQMPSEITPIWLSPLPKASDRLELDSLWMALQQRQQQHELVLLEALGGLGTPLTPETTVADLAWDWRIPTVLVVPLQPNAIADAVANVALANQSRLHLKGIILNQVRPNGQADEAGNGSDHQPDDLADDQVIAQLIQSLTHKPVLGCIPHLDPNNLSQLVRAAANLELERLGLKTALLS